MNNRLYKVLVDGAQIHHARVSNTMISRTIMPAPGGGLVANSPQHLHPVTISTPLGRENPLLDYWQGKKKHKVQIVHVEDGGDTEVADGVEMREVVFEDAMPSQYEVDHAGRTVSLQLVTSKAPSEQEIGGN